MAMSKKMSELLEKSPVLDKAGRMKRFNPTLYHPDQSLSDAEMRARKELKKKMSNRIWRLNNMYYIVNEKSKRQKFELNWAQKWLLKHLWYLNIILKARQLGFTTFICILFLDTCLFRDDTHCAIIAHTREDAEEFFQNKVKYAYQHLPEWFREERSAPSDSAKKLSFSNGSSLRVTTSGRSGTFYMLHISEFGKICARYPEKAREIVTGALNTVHAGQFVFIESTAEGNQGRFFEMCTIAKNRVLQKLKLNKMQYRFHFFAWWQNPDYVLDDDVPISEEMTKYFEEIESITGTELTRKQRNWYVMKDEEQGEDMKREFPSTPEEAFEASVVGAYYATQMTKIRKSGRIRKVHYDPMYPVDVFWDIGYNDNMALWFHQFVGNEHRFIRYFEGSGEGLQYYVDYMAKINYIYGTNYMPHDGRNHSPQTGETFEQYARNLGVRNIIIVQRALNQEEVGQGIQAVRNLLGMAVFDESLCKTGIKHLDGYKKKWDPNLEQFMKRPLHNKASNGADSMRCGAVGYNEFVKVDEADLLPEHTEDF